MTQPCVPFAVLAVAGLAIRLAARQRLFQAADRREEHRVIGVTAALGEFGQERAAARRRGQGRVQGLVFGLCHDVLPHLLLCERA